MFLVFLMVLMSLCCSESLWLWMCVLDMVEIIMLVCVMVVMSFVWFFSDVFISCVFWVLKESNIWSLLMFSLIFGCSSISVGCFCVSFVCMSCCLMYLVLFIISIWFFFMVLVCESMIDGLGSG